MLPINTGPSLTFRLAHMLSSCCIWSHCCQLSFSRMSLKLCFQKTSPDLFLWLMLCALLKNISFAQLWKATDKTHVDPHWRDFYGWHAWISLRAVLARHMRRIREIILSKKTNQINQWCNGSSRLVQLMLHVRFWCLLIYLYIILNILIHMILFLFLIYLFNKCLGRTLEYITYLTVAKWYLEQIRQCPEKTHLPGA